jgi:hypothetical protein
MMTLDKRTEAGLDLKIAASMANRAEVMLDSNTGTNVSVQELINALCDILDGQTLSDIKGMTGLKGDECLRIDAIRKAVEPLWTDETGKKILG